MVEIFEKIETKFEIPEHLINIISRNKSFNKTVSELRKNPN